MKVRSGALCAGLAVVACVLSACTPTAGRATASLGELGAYRGDNGLLSNVAGASFETASVADTAYAVRIAELSRGASAAGRASEEEPPSIARWRALWREDADDPLWKAHALCSALDAATARTVVGAEGAAIVDDARATAAALAHIDEAARSLDVLAAVHVAWCLGGEELIAPRTVAPLLAAVSTNAALALQWVDVLTGVGRPPADVVVDSAYLGDAVPATCDDRTSLEAAAVLVLASSPGATGAERCAIDDALDSDDPHVLLSALRVALRDGLERPDAVRSITTLVRERRAADGTHRRPARVTGSLSGTLAGLRLLTAGHRRVPGDEADAILEVMRRESRPASGDDLLVLAACATLDDGLPTGSRECAPFAEAGLRAGEAIAESTADTAAALDGLLAALALVRVVDPGRVDAIVGALSARPFRGCARTQVAVFVDVAATGTWHSAARAAARAAFREAALAADLTGYCDLSWAARLAGPGASPGAPPSRDPLPLDADGLLRWGDQPAPLSVAAAAADLGLYETETKR